MDEEKENRINVEDLPRAEGELTGEEAKDVQGGALTGSNTWSGPITLGSSSTVGNTVGGSLTGNTIGGSLTDASIDPLKR